MTELIEGKRRKSDDSQSETVEPITEIDAQPKMIESVVQMQDTSLMQLSTEIINSSVIVEIDDIEGEGIRGTPEQPKSGKRKRATEEGLHKCKVCSKAFTTSTNLRNHERVHSGIRPFLCKVCSKTFTQLSHLTTHNRKHSGEKPYLCKVCSRTFTESGNLKKHERIHTGEKPYSCEICSRTFAFSSNLKTHKRTHNGEKPYSCKVCLKTFTDSGNLKKHERTHNGEKPYSCKECSKTFTVLCSLKTHELTHTDEKPFTCKVCSKTFARSSKLKNHERVHNGEKPYTCKVCSKAFADSNGRKMHERTHSGERPYSCKICSKTFARSSQLNTHKRTHTGEKPYVCTHNNCEYASAQAGHLKEHIILMHSEEGMKRQKKKEQRFFKALERNHSFKFEMSEREHVIDFKCLDNTQTFARLDALRVTPELALWTELDEKGHEGMIKCDCKRTHTVIGNIRASGFTGKILQVRINPDAFKVDGVTKKVPYKDRIAAVHRILTEYKLPEDKEAGAVYCFYDTKTLPDGRKQLEMHTDKDFSLQDFVCDVIV